jgi:hypothetical protein
MVHQWEDIQQESEDIHIPLALDHLLPVLPCHRDGILCQREPTRCQYVAASMNSMRKHWKTSHQWSQQSRGGRVGQREQARGQAELARSYRRVAWQQVFPTRKGSHYIHIRYPDGRRQSPPPPPAEQAQREVDAMLAAWERARAQHEQQATIQADEATDANPWLRMTGWARYLDGVHPRDLQQLVEAPMEDAEAPEEDPKDRTEQAVRVIWDAMDQLARRSQRTMQRCGAGIRVEAARTEAGQTPYRPLQAYMDETSIQKHVQPWQQALAFIARTQAAQQAGQERDGGGGRREWLGRLPVYGMTPRQRQKWQVLWQLAMPLAPAERPAAAANTRARVRVVHTFAGAGQILEDVWDASPSPSPSPGTSASASASASASVVGVEEEEEEEEEADAVVDAEVEAWQMSAIKQACLEFCVKLLN